MVMFKKYLHLLLILSVSNFYLRKNQGQNNNNYNNNNNANNNNNNFEYSNKDKKEMQNERDDNIISNSKENKLYNGEDYTIQIFNTSSESLNIAFNQQSNASILNLGECGKYLESKYGSPLIIYKMDIERKNGITNQVEYSVYSSSGNEISLNECSSYSITTSNKINLVNSNLNTARINTTSKEGYDIFNPDDDFYTDLCTPYTNEYGTDVPMSKRKSDYYQSVDFCENDCSYVSFDAKNYRVNCSCSVKSTMSSSTSTTFSTISISSDSKFYDVFSSSNILVIKCTKLVFSIDGFNLNWGCYFALIIISIQIGLTISYLVIQLKPLEKKIEKFSSKNNINNNLDNQSLKISINSNNKSNSPKSNNKLNIENKNDKSNNNIQSIEELIYNNDDNLPPNPINRMNDNILLINNSAHKNVINESNKDTNIRIPREKIISNFSTNIHNTLIDDHLINGYTDEELNVLKFEDAIKYDTRTFFQHYYSILRYSQLIIFTFFNFNDYNHEIFKFSLFFWCILMYTTFNALFFVDKTMNKIYEDKGSLQFVSSLPKTIFSTISCAIINFLLKFLILSQTQIQQIKDEKELIKQKEKKVSFEKCFKIKVTIFFIIIFLLLIIFWYYLSAFCAVYKNTQKHLFKDTAMSFIMSMIYPFIICFFSSVFRYFSFKRNSKCLYSISRFIQIF